MTKASATPSTTATATATALAATEGGAILQSGGRVSRVAGGGSCHQGGTPPLLFLPLSLCEDGHRHFERESGEREWVFRPAHGSEGILGCPVYVQRACGNSHETSFSPTYFLQTGEQGDSLLLI